MPNKSSKKPTIFYGYREVRPLNIAVISRGRTPRFRDKVYRIVKKIPRGRVLSYKEVARFAGRPQAWRAVGNILNKNRDPKIPCHRVIRSDGKIGGYNRGQKRKIKLLKQEGLFF